jgi:hypothetical protein
MLRKTPKNKSTDPDKSKKDVASPHLIIPTRHLMRDGMDDEDNSGSDINPEPATAPKVPKSKPIAIVPDEDNTDENSNNATGDDDSSTPVNVAVRSKPAKHMDIKPETKAAPQAEESKQADGEETKPSASKVDEESTDANGKPESSSDKQDEADGDEPDKSSSSPSADTKKAVEKAEKELSRQRELQGYIESKQFFVPVGTVARKRSIKISFGLTVMFFLLSLILIDLMLDSGVILLVQRIPHTHFFTVDPSAKN